MLHNSPQSHLAHRNTTKIRRNHLIVLATLVAFFLTPSQVFAVGDTVASFTSQALTTITLIASLVAGIVLIFGGYRYITSSGRPDQVDEAKRTISKALIGLLIVLGAGLGSTLLKQMITTPAQGMNPTQLILQPISPITPTNSLTQVISDAIVGLLQNVLQSSAKPITNALLFFLSTTPSVVSNTTIFNFWLIMVGIADSLFVLLIALLGLQFMSATTFGFEELELKQLFPRIGLAFLVANLSIFLVDAFIQTSNVLVSVVLNATGGIGKAWLFTAFDPATIFAGNTPLVTLLFLLIFVILAVVLLLFYISRLIIVALGTVLSPFLCLLWAFPKGADFVEVTAKTYLITIFSVFVQVVIVQLASAFFTIGGDLKTNSFLSLLVAIGLMLTLLKTPALLSNFVFYTTSTGLMKNLGMRLMNTITTSAPAASSQAAKEHLSSTLSSAKRIHLRN